MLKTEFEFSLPLGFIDAEGELHRDGLMRLATAADEILPLRDPRVRSNEAYLTIIVLSRVITRLGSLERVTPGVIERLFAADLAYLQDVYNRINRPPHFGAGAAIDADGDRHPLDEDHGAAWESGTARSDSSAATDDDGAVWSASRLEPVALGGSKATPSTSSTRR
jgi:hypothetical protein